MTRWIKCPGCDGEVGVPDGWTEALVKCPNCTASVAVEPEGHIQWRPPQSDASEHDPDDKAGQRQAVPNGRKKIIPNWYLPVGLVSVCIAAAGFMASANLGGGGGTDAAMLAGALNPLFFVGGPLGLYWLYQWVCFSSGKNFFCPHCDAGINWTGSHGDLVVCWNCKKRLRKP